MHAHAHDSVLLKHLSEVWEPYFLTSIVRDSRISCVLAWNNVIAMGVIVLLTQKWDVSSGSNDEANIGPN